ncbi:MAG: hypothetical protein JWO22_1293 [Frankiales bacterium]|nr:hypothetical protein [Frankiales bacterium]
MSSEQGTALRLQGIIDSEACSAVRRELAPRLAAGVRHVVLDLSDVTEVHTPGVLMMRSLDAHLRRLRGGLVITHASPYVASTLRVHELDHLQRMRDLEQRATPPPARTEPETLPNLLPLVRRA